jgi:superfamily I DNA and/or RNA helicase
VVAFILLIFDRELSNAGEAVLVSQLTLGLLEILGNKKYSIAIITPYNAQRTAITSLLHAR